MVEWLMVFVIYLICPPIEPSKPDSPSERIKEIEAEIERIKKPRRKWQEAFLHYRNEKK
jgi:hypothetical protein